MTCKFERIDVENEEYEAWDSLARPLRVFVKQTPDWLGLELGDSPQPGQLRNAILEFARVQQVQLGDSLENLEDPSRLLEAVTLAVRKKRESESWWQRLKRHL